MTEADLRSMTERGGRSCDEDIAAAVSRCMLANQGAKVVHL
jgi:hypothetical protein